MSSDYNEIGLLVIIRAVCRGVAFFTQESGDSSRELWYNKFAR